MVCPFRDELQVGKSVVAVDVERNVSIRNGIRSPLSKTPNVLITHGVHMTKQLLVLLLITMQLLAGSGASVYLCIGCDGSIGIETNAESCQCDDDHTDGVSYLCECEDRHCEHRETPAQVQSTGEDVSKDSPCGCTHIPLIVSSERSRHFVRTLANHEAGRLLLLTAVPPNACLCYSLVNCMGLRWHVACADVPDFSLTVVSTVVIRC